MEEKLMRPTFDKIKNIARLALLAGAVVAPALAAAQEFPNRQVTLVVPFGPGGSNDTYGRYLAEGLTKLWKQTVIVENRPGAGSAIGSAHVSQAKPNGYTLLFVSTSFTTNAATLANLPFDPIKGLAPVGVMGISDLFVMTGSRVPLPTLQELQKQAKAQTIFAGTPGVGSVGHLALLLLAETQGVKFEYVHQKSGAAVQTDLGGGRTDVATGVLFEANSGNAKPIAVMSDKRSASLPDVPTVMEAGFPAAQANIWFGIFAPGGTPKEVVDKINKDIVAVMKSPEAAEFLKAQALQISDESPEQFGNRVKGEIDKWTALAEKNGLRK
jgi:tripartite-type tricarboxylate transporter receptor subunit TctC